MNVLWLNASFKEFAQRRTHKCLRYLDKLLLQEMISFTGSPVGFWRNSEMSKK